MSDTETESTRGTVAAFLGNIANQDMKGALALLHHDVEINEPASLAYGGVHKAPADSFRAC